MNYPKSFWNEKYAPTEYIYGKSPNQFLADELIKFDARKILFAAEGEGRNAVFAAQKGWEVHAFDMSHKAQEKAFALAKENDVRIQYQVGNANEIDYHLSSFDAIALIYAHFSSKDRRAIHQKLLSLLKTHGLIIFEAFSQQQLNYQNIYNSGGPQDFDMLFSEEDILKEFNECEVLHLETKEVNLKEGEHHVGLASVIRFLGRKK